MNWVKNDDGGMLKPGDIFEKYRVEKLLGKGGMGAVYLVRHNVLDSLFALKVLFPNVAAKNKQFVDRFIREARLACKIKHPNLISVHDAGKNSENGMYYIIMDYVSGGSVRDLLKKIGHFSPEQAVSIIRQIASALETARKHDMVHRDIKPDNIMFTSDGTAKLADLGIAKSTNEQDTMLTMEASVFGTPAYMSPEQAMDSRKVDCRADIYSLGIVFYEMLSGQRPYRGSNTIEILSQVVRDEDIPDIQTLVPSIPADLAELLNQMCAKNIQKRIQSPSELLRRLEKIIPTIEKNACPDKTVPSEETEITLPTIIHTPKTNGNKTLTGTADSPEVTMPTMEAGPLPSDGLSDAPEPSTTTGSTPIQTSPNVFEIRNGGETSVPEKHSFSLRHLDKKKNPVIICFCFFAAAVLSGGIFFALVEEKPLSAPSPKQSAKPPLATPSQLSAERNSPLKNCPEKIDSAAAPIVSDPETSPFDPLKKNTLVLLGGATEQLKSFKEEYIKRNGAANISFLEAANFSQYRKQLSKIIGHSPRFVILAPAGRYAELGISRSNFDLLILNEANMLRDKGIPFAFIVETPENSAKIQEFNNSIRELCNLRSFTLIEAAEDSPQSLYAKISQIFKH